MRRHETGVALITVLLVVAMATILVTIMISRQHQLLRRTEALATEAQAWQYGLGAEAIAIQVLAQDARNDSNKSSPRDYPGEFWHKDWPPYPVEGGSIKGRIEDEQGRFNLNSMVIGGQKNPAAVAIFQRLLTNLHLSESIAIAAVDWMDENNEPEGYDGAESDWYLRLKPAYRAANRPFKDISELRLVRGVDQKAFDALRPLICTLPGETPININTASPEVVAALGSGASASAKEKDGYGSVDEFLQSPAMSNMDPQEKSGLQRLLSVQSQYFRVNSEVSLDGRKYPMSSLIHRQSADELQVVRRQKGFVFSSQQTQGIKREGGGS